MESESSVCVVCLSCNTTLWPLGEYMQLYKMLLGKENEPDLDMKPFTCADCQDMFQKIQIFQLKIRSSQDILLMRVNSEQMLTEDKIDLKDEFENPSNNIAVEIDYYKSNDDCKDEPFDNDSVHFNIEDDVIDDIKQEFDEEKQEFNIETVKDENLQATNVYNNVKKYNRRSKQISFNIVSGLELIKRNYKYYIKTFCNEDVKKLDEEARMSWSFRNSKVKCRSCVKGFNKTESLQKHMKNKHSESIGPFVCDICGVRTATKKSLESHVNQHYYRYDCCLCEQSFYKKWQLRIHFSIRHKKVFECPKCGIVISKRREFKKHYNMMHQRYICDYCGKLYTDRHWFENHILKVHTSFECKPCNKTFKLFKSFDAHNKLLHTTAVSESTYCVECDIQFENQVRYQRHISNSTRHLGRNRKKSANCPECGKLYSCRSNMMNHYRLVHLKVTNYQCKDCSRFFLNSFRLKEHRLVNHEKKGRTKNKICSYCGRGFSNNRILLYHVRTHTGERPHACEHCSATFAQPFALATHVKARHKDVLK